MFMIQTAYDRLKDIVHVVSGTREGSRIQILN